MNVGKTARFAAVGIVTAALYYAFLLTTIELMGVDVVAASATGYVLAVLLNYAMHYYWTFRSESSHGATLFRFALMLALGFGVNLIIMSAGTRWLDMHYLLLQTIAIALIATLNLGMSSYWVFR